MMKNVFKTVRRFTKDTRCLVFVVHGSFSFLFIDEYPEQVYSLSCSSDSSLSFSSPEEVRSCSIAISPSNRIKLVKEFLRFFEVFLFAQTNCSKLSNVDHW